MARDEKPKKRQETILDRIGGTPLVPINRLNPNRNVEILAKLESFNPGGSVKDRPALFMIQEAEKSGDLSKDKIILEATSGNTGIGLAQVAAVKGYRILLVMSEAVSEERKKILRALGAELQFTPEHLGTDGAIEFVYNLIREHPGRYWLADQFNNEANWLAHYHGTAAEIWEQTEGSVDKIVATMGTTGTLMGISRRFRELSPGVEIIGVEPYLGHKIQGLKNMKESYRPEIFDKSLADRIINIEDDEAYNTARMLARKEGIFAGMSSGAAMAIALRLSAEMTRGRILVILPDGGERYLSTPLFLDKEKSGLLLYNTLSRKKEEFVPFQEKQVAIYSCGPTVNGNVPLGQFRRFVVADLLRRYLESMGYVITHVVNITDLDDSTIEGADRAGMPLADFTEKYYLEFLKDLDELGIKRASAYPKARDHVEEMIAIAQKLVEKGFAYEKLRSVYFDISRFMDYGKLSKIDLNKIRLGKTVDLEQYEKENPRDFTLLKRSTLKELKSGTYYQTKWGNVRPSWHLECPALAQTHLGETYDIHISGVDLIFPHHENTIAISKAVTGTSPARYWVHNELVRIEGEKQSRGSGNSHYTIASLLEKGYTGRDIRYWLISRHYRKPITFSWDEIETASKTVSNLDKFVKKVHACRNGPDNPEMDQLIYNVKRTSVDALNDDLNIAPALAALFRFTHEINALMDADGLSAADRDKILETLEMINSVLGVIDMGPQEADEDVEALIKQREEARKHKDWTEADRIRDELLKMNIELIDTREGPVWRRHKG